MMNYASMANGMADYDFYIAQSLINRWHIFNNDSKRTASDSILCGRLKVLIHTQKLMHMYLVTDSPLKLITFDNFNWRIFDFTLNYYEACKCSQPLRKH